MAYAGSTSGLVCGNPAVGYVVPRSRLKCELSGGIHMQIASFTNNASAMQYPSVIPADGMVFCSCMFNYGRFVCEAFELLVKMLMK